MLVAPFIILLLKHKKQTEHKYITTPKFNIFSGSIFDERLNQTNLAATPDLGTVSQRAIKLKKK